MYLNDNAYVPLTGRNYVPATYRYDQGRWYLGRQGTRSPSDNLAPTGYDFNTSKSSLAGDKFQTVEQIIHQGYLTIPQGDPVTAIIADKQWSAFLGLDDLISQIRSRYDLYRQNMGELLQSECSTINVFHQHVFSYGGGLFASDRAHYSLNKRLQDVYRQQRDERVTLWQDVSRLRQLMAEKTREFLSSYRKIAVLNDVTGDDL